MVTLSNEYQKAVALLWGTISPDGDEDEILQGWEHALRYLASILGSTGGTVSIKPIRQRRSLIPIRETWPQGVILDFFERGLYEHPTLLQMQDSMGVLPLGKVHPAEVLVPDYWHSDFVRTVKPMGVAYACGLNVPLDKAGRFVGELGFSFREPTCLAPSLHELMEALGPMVSKAVGFYRLWWEHRLQSELLARLPCTVDLEEDPYYFYVTVQARWDPDHFGHLRDRKNLGIDRAT